MQVMAFNIGATTFMKSHLNSLIQLGTFDSKQQRLYIQNKITMGRVEICKTKIASHADALDN